MFFIFTISKNSATFDSCIVINNVPFNNGARAKCSINSALTFCQRRHFRMVVHLKGRHCQYNRFK